MEDYTVIILDTKTKKIHVVHSPGQDANIAAAEAGYYVKVDNYKVIAVFAGTHENLINFIDESEVYDKVVN